MKVGDIVEKNGQKYKVTKVGYICNMESYETEPCDNEVEKKTKDKKDIFVDPFFSFLIPLSPQPPIS